MVLQNSLVIINITTANAEHAYTIVFLDRQCLYYLHFLDSTPSRVGGGGGETVTKTPIMGETAMRIVKIVRPV